MCLRSFLSLLLSVRTCWDCLNLITKARPSYIISMLPIWQGINTSVSLIINLWMRVCCRESTGHPPNTSATLINNGCIDLWRQCVVTQVEFFSVSQNNTVFVLFSVVLIVTWKDYYYLVGCTTFPHLPAPIWQLYYLLPPFASVIPVFFHYSLFSHQSSNPFRSSKFRSTSFSSSWWTPFHNFFW